jgi:2Fe-2S ferredoxin
MSAKTITIIAFDRQGNRHEVMAEIGKAMMWSLRGSGLPIEALCGGCAACGTCHVYVLEEWVDKLPPRREIEEDLLDSLAHCNERFSRLSCQIICDESMAGVAVTLAPEE